jgi:hydrogenase maturation protein HypF
LVDEVADPASERGRSPGTDAAASLPAGGSHTLRIILTGRVQGVGFRPFVYRIAREFGLGGYVQNRVGEVEVVVRGATEKLDAFTDALLRRAPPLSQPVLSRREPAAAAVLDEFVIRESRGNADAQVFVPPDYYMCPDCSRELEDAEDRRYRYPFINCTQCGPRYTLIEALPYDRPNTSMAGFPLCADCEREYRDPADRRFHAEPVACPVCGPSLSFREAGGELVSGTSQALDAAVACLRAGRIVAVKGIGGYHIVCDAANDAAVACLRERKRRPAKPFAVMFPFAGADGLEAVSEHVELTTSERDALQSPVRPIVLARRKHRSGLSREVAPGLAELGVFLPYSPLHHLLLGELGRPLVATSGNISGEPVLIDNVEADDRLGPVVDAFLHHDRPIVRPADDPVQRRIAGRMRPLRHGRGTAPCELRLPRRQPQPTLAVGAHMKGTVTLSWRERSVVSPHIGEMDSPRSLAVFERLVADLQSLYGVSAERIACDAHRGYTTHRWAQAQSLPVDTVWHHHAHASALAGEYALYDDSLVFTWDGVGLGEDGTLWGGEALHGAPGRWRRVASLRPFRLPGGDKAGREPWRSAAALMWECGRDAPWIPDEYGLARTAWQKHINSPTTTAAGRLFDAAAALVLEQTHVSFEAEGPMLLESLCRGAADAAPVDHALDDDGIWRADWSRLLEVLGDPRRTREHRAEVFHASMAQLILEQALRVREVLDVRQVGLCGGVFQNRVLTEAAVALLEDRGFRVFVPERLPCNDAAISFGQAVESAARFDGG